MEQIIDLTLNYDQNIPGFQSSVAKTIKEDGWNATNYHFYSHCGTHMDAPVHFGVNDQSIDQIAVSRFFCDCHIIRITDIQPGALITIQHIKEIQDKIKKGEGVIFHTNWSKHLPDLQKWRNELPRISKELAQFLVNQGITMVGVEPPSVADVNNITEVTTIHRILLGGDVIIIEGLTNLEKIGSDYVQIIALPLKVKNGDGAPARVIAVEPTN